MIVHESRKQVTTLLGEIQAGNDEANNLLFTLVYEELTQLAGQLMRGERHGHTLEPTALVNEAVLRLLDQDVLEQTRNRAHFFGTAARAMRQVLVDHARSRAARKRGGAAQRVPLDSVLDSFHGQNIDVLALDEALTKLSKLEKRQSDVVVLRFFGGLTMSAIAGILGFSVATIENDFRIARAWLRGQIGGIAR